MKFNERLNNLLSGDGKIVERRKIIFSIPLAIVVLAALMMIIFRFTLGNALNLGTDFTGGYSVDVKLGNSLTKSNFPTYSSQIENVLSSVTAENGKTYKISISGAIQRQGSGDDSSIHVKYSAVRGVSETEMSKQVNPAIVKALEEGILHKVPKVAINGKTITVTYDEVLNNYGGGNPYEVLCTAFKNGYAKINTDHKAGIALADDAFAYGVKDGTKNGKQIVITCTNNVANTKAVKNAIVKLMVMPDSCSGSVSGGDLVGATVSTELLFNAILAVALALIFMLCYIGLRFQLSSGLACIIALFHDVLMMFAFMAICHIEINSTFIAALITILGYSINNSIIIFDRVRENMRSIYSKSMSPEQIANKSVGETLVRSINTTITTLIMILMVAILGVSDIKIFAFPIIIGLLSGTFSSICIAPSIWALFQRVGKKNKDRFDLGKDKSEKKDKRAKQAKADA